MMLVSWNKVHLRLLDAYILLSVCVTDNVCTLHMILFFLELLHFDQKQDQGEENSKGLWEDNSVPNYSPGACVNQAIMQIQKNLKK